jgi:hypothetical protein
MNPTLNFFGAVGTINDSGIPRAHVVDELPLGDLGGLHAKQLDERGVISHAPPRTSEEIKQKIFKNMSTRASQLLQEDLANLGPQKLSDVEGAQSEVVNIAKRLETEGKIQINRGGGDTFV